MKFSHQGIWIGKKLNILAESQKLSVAFRIFPPEALPSEEKIVREKKEKDLIHLKNEKNHGEL